MHIIREWHLAPSCVESVNTLNTCGRVFQEMHRSFVPTSSMGRTICTAVEFVLVENPRILHQAPEFPWTCTLSSIQCSIPRKRLQSQTLPFKRNTMITSTIYLEDFSTIQSIRKVNHVEVPLAICKDAIIRAWNHRMPCLAASNDKRKTSTRSIVSRIDHEDRIHIESNSNATLAST